MMDWVHMDSLQRVASCVLWDDIPMHKMLGKPCWEVHGDGRVDVDVHWLVMPGEGSYGHKHV